MDSDASIRTVLNTISNCKNSDVDFPDEVLYSEPSPTSFSQPPFQPMTPPIPVEPCLSPSSQRDASPNLFPLSGSEPDVPSPIEDDQLELDSDQLISHQQQLHNTNTSLKIHQLTHSASFSKLYPTRANRFCMKRKHPNATPQFF